MNATLAFGAGAAGSASNPIDFTAAGHAQNPIEFSDSEEEGGVNDINPVMDPDRGVAVGVLHGQ